MPSSGLTVCDSSTKAVQGKSVEIAEELMKSNIQVLYSQEKVELNFVFFLIFGL